MSKVVSQLNAWLGIVHQVSLVDRHESNGVERTNGNILRHLRALVADERIATKWALPHVISFVQFILNASYNEEIGMAPFMLHYGSQDAEYRTLPSDSPPADANAYLQELDKDLSALRNASSRFQANLITERNTIPEVPNTFVSGDLVLLLVKPSTKLSPRFSGPYEVLQQNSNNVELRHLVMGNIITKHVSELKIYHGTHSSAVSMAQLDADQFTVETFLAYRGDPAVRTTLEFFVRFVDSTEVWLPYSIDIFDTVPYEEFCRATPELWHLVYKLTESKKLSRELNRTPITNVKPGDKVFVDLRSYGAAWFDSIGLPESYLKRYVVLYNYTKWTAASHLKIQAYCPIFKETFTVNHMFVRSYGSTFSLDPNMILVDSALVQAYPSLLPTFAKEGGK